LRCFSLSSCRSTQSESPLAPKSCMSFKICTQLWTELFVFNNLDYPTSTLTVTGLVRVNVHVFFFSGPEVSSAPYPVHCRLLFPI
jgi:cytochrome c oxidase subunit IV